MAEELIENSAKEKKPTGFFKEKILMNTSFVYGILFGLFAQKYLIGAGGRSYEGIIFRLLRQLFY